jgi:Bifunctional DNA primase/polymerase, N-terminal/AAA domain/Primase C terminal 2 (PriCT-2)
VTAAAPPERTRTAASPTVADALDYAARGWPVFPLFSVRDGRCSCGESECEQKVTRRGKHPRTAHGLKDATTDEATIRDWWAKWPDANIGVVTGPPSGLLMVGPDGDKGKADLAALETEHGELPVTVTAASGAGGEHRIFWYPSDGKVPSRKNLHGTAIDVRGEGGYFIAAPSVNGSGPYRWVIDPDETQLAEPPAWLLDWCRRSQDRKADSEDRPKRETSDDKPTAARVAAALEWVKGADDYDRWVEVGMSLHSWDTLTGFALWCDWSSTSDKYDEDECLKKWKSFDSGASRTIATVLWLATQAGWKPPIPVIKGTGKKEGKSDDKGAGESKGEGSEQANKPVTAILSLGDLLDKHPKLRPVVIEGLLRRGETMNVIASSKVGKSWGMLDLALAKATGGNWLGAFPCSPGRVLYVDNELHPETLADRFRKVAAERQIPMATVREMVRVLPLRGRITDWSQLGRLFKEWGVKAGDFDFTVFDAFYRFLPAGTEENSNGDLATIYNWVDELAGTFEMSTALVHHSSKGDQSQKSVTDVGSGAGSMSRATDTHLVFRPHEEESVAVMDVALRSFPPIPSRCYRWEFPVWTPADNLSPELLGSPTRKKQEQAAEARTRKGGTLLLTRLDDVDPKRLGYGLNRLRHDLGWHLDKIHQVVAALVQEGILETITIKVPKGSRAETEAAGVRRRTRN